MVRDDDRHAARTHVLGNEGREGLRAARIEIGERLVEQPERSAHAEHPGHGDAPPLPGRQHPHGKIRTTFDTGALQDKR